MNLDSESFLPDSGALTALICIGASSAQRTVSTQLVELNYKVHLGLFEEDISLKLATYSYNVVVVEESFGRCKPAENPIVREITRRSGAARRAHLVVLLSRDVPTNDASSAFARSVDLVVNLEDLPNLKPILRRAVSEHAELYTPFLDAIRQAQAV